MTAPYANPRPHGLDPEIAIGRATLPDAAAMHELQQRAFAEEGRRVGRLPDGQEIPPLAEPLDSIVAHIRAQTALVARHDGRIVGAIRGVLDDRVCVIRALVVDEAHRGRGLGSALLVALEAALPEADRFDLTTNMVMQGNVPFYERHGYRIERIDHHGANVRLAQMTKSPAHTPTP